MCDACAIQSYVLLGIPLKAPRLVRPGWAQAYVRLLRQYCSCGLQHHCICAAGFFLEPSQRTKFCCTLCTDHLKPSASFRLHS